MKYIRPSKVYPCKITPQNLLLSYQAQLVLGHPHYFYNSDAKDFFFPHPQLLEEVFEKSLIELQTSFYGNLEISLKFEPLELFQHVERASPDLNVSTLEKEKEAFIIKGLSLLPGKEKKFVLDVKIPNMAHSVLDNPVEIKIASCQIVFTLLNG